MSSAVQLAKDSYTRSAGKDVIGRFYEIFLKSHPHIAPLFAETDFVAQKETLNHGMHLAIMFAEGQALGKTGLERIRQSHCRNRLNISPMLYPYWKKSFLQAISETDPQFNEETRKAWDSVLQQTIDFISGGYDAY